MTKKVLVIGGGVAGLTAAQLLNERGFTVTVLEATESCGGQAKTWRDNEGYPCEHSLRVYHENYYYLFDLLKQIPYKKRTAYDNLHEMSSVIHDSHENFHFVKYSKDSVIEDLKQTIGIIKYAHKQGITYWEIIHFLAIIYRNGMLCENAARKKLANIPFNDLIDLHNNPKLRKFMFAIAEIGLVCTPDSEAWHIIEAYLYSSPLFKKIYCMNGPTSERFIEPWINYLIKKGILIKKNSVVTDMLFENNKFKACKLRDGKIIEADYVILAVDILNLRKLLHKPNIAKVISNTNNYIKVNAYSSHGIQYYMSDLPKVSNSNTQILKYSNTQILECPVWAPGVLCFHIDTDWKIVSIMQGKPFWQKVELPKRCKFILSVNFAPFDNNGVKSNKKFYEYTEKEITDEVLHQMKFTEKDLIIKANIDKHLVWLEKQEYLKQKEMLLGHEIYHRTDGNYLIDLMQFHVPEVGNDKIQPRAHTNIANLFMAGVICNTHYKVPTMEKACESGYLAVKALLEKDKEHGNLQLKYTYDTVQLSIFRKLSNLFNKN